MDLANDERILRLNEQIQREIDQQKLMLLVEELTRLLDELSAKGKTPQPSNGVPYNDAAD